jgi:flagellar assembly factor FliW
MNQPSSPTQAPHRIQTRFGEFDVTSPANVTFPDGIPGFEACRRFILIAADELSPLSCLQALDAPCPSFLAANPLTIRADYRMDLGQADRFKLGVRSGDPLLWLVILTVELHRVTANLKAPIVINSRQMVGRQVCIDEPDYPICAPIEI